MNIEYWKKLEEIFVAATELPAVERAKFAREKCGADTDLFRDAARLLELDVRENLRLDSPVFTVGTKILASEEDDYFAPGEQFASYLLHMKIGRGGMGTVYLAEDVRLQRSVALKFLPAHLADDAATIQRFQQEARAASNVSHPNVAHIYEFGQHEGRYFLAMEFVPGRTLRELIQKNAVRPEKAVEITLQIAAALQAAHRNGIVHRDVKPENVVVMDDGLVKILDFGLAKLTGENTVRRFASDKFQTNPGLILGTTAYMSPEQLRGQPLDERADIWSLGVCLYEMLTGERPFAGETASDVQAAILLAESKPLSRSVVNFEDFSRIIKKTLVKNAAERYQTIANLITDLKEIKWNLENSSEVSNIVLAHSNPEEIKTGRISALDTSDDKKSTTGNVRLKQSERGKLPLVFGALILLIIATGASYFFSINLTANPGSNEAAKSVQTPDTRSRNSAAESEYQAGIYIWNKRNGSEMPKALAHFQQAIELDPGFARAYAGLAHAYLWGGNQNLTRKEAIAHARAAVRRALSIDPNLAEAHTILASFHGQDWNWAEAEREFRRAIESDPNYPTAHHWFAECLTFLAKDEEAVEHINRALELDPLSFAILNDSITIYWYNRRYREALANAEKMIEFDARYEERARLWMARLYALLGNREQARKEFRRHEELSNGKVLNNNYANFYALVGDKETALTYLRKVENSGDKIEESWTTAGTYSVLEMREEAFKWTEIAFENRNPSIIALGANSDFDFLRSDPRYLSLLKRMNLAEYWADKLSVEKH